MHYDQLGGNASDLRGKVSSALQYCYSNQWSDLLPLNNVLLGIPASQERRRMLCNRLKAFSAGEFCGNGSGGPVLSQYSSTVVFDILFTAYPPRFDISGQTLWHFVEGDTSYSM